MDGITKALDVAKREVAALASGHLSPDDALNSLAMSPFRDGYVGAVRLSNDAVMQVVLTRCEPSANGLASFHVSEVAFVMLPGGAGDITGNLVRTAPIGAVIDRIRQAVLEHESGQSEGVRIAQDGTTAFLPSDLISRLSAAWGVSSKGRQRVDVDWLVLAEADALLRSQGVRSPAKLLAEVMGTTSAVISNRLSKARKLGLYH